MSTSLRYREARADLFWVETLLYFGLSQERGRVPTHATDIIDDVITLDPFFKHAYRLAALFTQYQGLSKIEAAKRAVYYNDLGAGRFPNDWEFPFYAGAAYLMDMPSSTPEERRRNRTEAASYIQRAAILGMGHGAPYWLPSLAATVLTDLGKREMALRQLEDSMLAAPDEATRQRIKNKLIHMRGRVEAEKTEKTASDFHQRKLHAFPYVTIDMFVLLGGRIAEKPFDWRADLAASLPMVLGGEESL